MRVRSGVYLISKDLADQRGMRFAESRKVFNKRAGWCFDHPLWDSLMRGRRRLIRQSISQKVLVAHRSAVPQYFLPQKQTFMRVSENLERFFHSDYIIL